jgi:hypothetical protein
MKKKSLLSLIITISLFTFFYFQGRDHARFESLPKSVKSLINTPIPKINKKNIVTSIDKVEDDKVDQAHIGHGLGVQEELAIEFLVNIKEVAQNRELLNNMHENERDLIFNRLKQMLINPDVHWLAKRQILSQKSKYSLFVDEEEKMRTLASVDSRATAYASLTEEEFIELILENSQEDDK